MEYRIKELLREKKCSITELADKIGIQRETLSRIINGASTSSDTLQKIADALEVPISELFEHPKQDGVAGFIEHNGVIYKISSVADIEDLLKKIKESEG